MSNICTTVSRTSLRRARSIVERLESRRLLSAGSVDTTFGINGVVDTSFAPTHEDASPVAVLVEHDYKSVVVGTAGPGFSSGGGNSDFMIARFTTAGKPDTTFGKNGTTLTDFGGQNDSATAAALQIDGKTVVAGYGGNGNLEFARYTTSGILDATFGAGGRVTTNLGTSARPNAIAIDSEGRIVVLGVTDPQYAGYLNFLNLVSGNLFLARYLPSGKLDTTFGHNGIVSYTSGTFAGIGANSLAIDSAGRIVVGGSMGNKFLAARFTSAGTLDSSFGTKGVAQVSFKGAATAVSLDIVSGGKIVLGGSNVPVAGDTTFALARLGSNGALDTTFGVSGITTSDFGAASVAHDMTIQRNGGILLVGTENPQSALPDSAVIARYTAAGKLDTTFNHTGVVLYNTVDEPGRDNADAFAVAVQIDGRILVAGDMGVSDVDFTDTVVLTRFLGDAPASASGNVFDDTNGNGILNAGEAGLPSVRLYLDLNDNGVDDAGVDYYVTTDAKGNYTFANLAPGTYEIREVVPAGRHLTAPAGGVFTLTLTAGQNLTGKNFGNKT